MNETKIPAKSNNKKNKEEMLTLTSVKELGFSPKMIETLLPEPILKDNPHYRCAAPMKLWKKKDVNKAMRTKAFKESLKGREKRRQGAARAVETKKAKLHEEVEEQIKQIQVKRINIAKLRQRALDDKQDWYDYQSMLRSNLDFKSAYDADEATIERWMVNYIRHNLTNYDEDLYEMAGKVGCHEEYMNYRRAVMSKIEEIYPELKAECKRQH